MQPGWWLSPSSPFVSAGFCSTRDPSTRLGCLGESPAELQQGHIQRSTARAVPCLKPASISARPLPIIPSFFLTCCPSSLPSHLQSVAPFAPANPPQNSSSSSVSCPCHFHLCPMPTRLLPLPGPQHIIRFASRFLLSSQSSVLNIWSIFLHVNKRWLLSCLTIQDISEARRSPRHQ